MALDRHVERLLAMLSSAGAAGQGQRVQDRRDSFERLAVLTADPSEGALEVVEQDLAAPGPNGRSLHLRAFEPKTSSGAGVLFLHGGGWVAGGLDTHGGLCRTLASRSGCGFYALDYSLAPEHPFPAALEDAAAAYAWLLHEGAALGLDTGRIGLAGDSAGGNLAAALTGALIRPALALKSLAPAFVPPPLRTPAVLLLICPILDLAAESASRRAFADGYFLSAAAFAEDLNAYAGPLIDRRDPRLSPLQADSLSGAPPMVIHLAEYDPFRDEGLAYAEKARSSGVTVACRVHPGMIHYFYAMPQAVPYARRALDEIAQDLARLLRLSGV